MSAERLDIFVGTDRSQLLAVPVLEFSIKRHASRPVRVAPLIDLDLPEPKDIRQGARTNFSFARFAIPELMGFKGRGLYLDADMLALRDIAEIWRLSMGEAKILIQEGVDPAAQEKKPGAPATRIKQCSVMLMDCSRLDWRAPEIIAGLDGRYTYEQLLHEMCVLSEDEIAYALPFRWNSLEHFDSSTCLIHYTDMHTQPWVDPFNKNGWLWLAEVRLMLECGLMRWRDLEQEVELGYFRPSLIDELRETPRPRGWDEAKAHRYAEIDARANFVKHREVYARKRARDVEVKAYEAAQARGAA
jgi:lipopolysaccharide biosynthesis glycosyltransferase